MLGLPCLTLRTCSVARQLAGPQAVPIGHQDHRGVAVAPAIALGGFQQPLDLGLRQVLAGPQVGVAAALHCDCSFLSPLVTPLID